LEIDGTFDTVHARAVVVGVAAGRLLSHRDEGDGRPQPCGLLSFSGPGITIALDFRYSRMGGRICPAKEARMSGRNFRRVYPHWENLLPYIDPRFSSSFWR
jgi:hypothetical protein